MRSSSALGSQYAIALVLYSLVGILTLWKLLITPGTIGLARDWPFPPYSQEYQQWAAYDLSLFSDVGGGTANLFRFNYPLTSLLGALSLSGLNGDSLSKIVVLGVLSGSGFSMFLLSRALRLGLYGSSLAGLFYMMTPDVFGRLHEGHLSYLVSYALSPLALTLFVFSIRTRSSRTLLSGAIVYSLAWAQGQFLVLLPILLFSYLVFTSRSFASFNFGLRGLLLFNIVAVLTHNLWTIPILWGTNSVGIVSTQLSQSLSLQLTDAIRLRGYTVLASPFDGEISSLGGTVLLALGFLPSIVWSLAVNLKPRERETLCFAAIGILSLFLAGGARSLLGTAYLANLATPLFSLFRDPEHFLFLTAVSYSVLIGQVAGALLDRLFRVVSGRTVHLKSPQRIFVLLGWRPVLAFLLAVVLVLPTSAPFFTGNVGGALQVYDLGGAHQAAYRFIDSQEGYFHIAWLPLGSVGFAENSEIGPSRDPTIALSPKPAIDPHTVVWNPYFAFLSMTSVSNATKHLAKLLGLADVKYVITRNDFTPYGLQVSNGTALVSGQQGLHLVTSFGDKDILLNEEHLPIVYSTTDSVLVVGDRSALISLSYLTQRQNNSLPLVFFASDLSSDDASLLDMVNSVFIMDNDYLDLATLFVPNDYKIDAGKFANGAEPRSGWTYVGRAWSYGWHLTTPIEPVAVTGIQDTLEIPFSVGNPATYELWARVYGSERASYISFSIGNERVADVNTHSQFERGFGWVKIGSIDLPQGNHVIRAISGPGENLLGRIVAAPSHVLDQALQTTMNRLKDKRVTNLLEPEHVVSENDDLVSTRQWGKESSQGFVLQALSPLSIDLPVWAPFDGNYSIRFRSNKATLQQNVLDDFKTSERWAVSGQGTISVESSLRVQGESSLKFSFVINQTSPDIHVLYKELPEQDWSKYDTLGFWVFPRTNVSPVYIVVSARNLSGEWFTSQYYAQANSWTYVQLDVSSWNRGRVDQLRLVFVGDIWKPYEDGQQVDLFLEQLSLLRLYGADSFAWGPSTSTRLEAGYNSVSYVLQGPGSALDLLLVERINASPAEGELQVTSNVSFDRITPTRYEISETPPRSFLVQAINYDPNWEAKDGASALPHFRAFGSFNSYWVGDPLQGRIVLQFSLERINEIGNYVVLATFLAVLLAIAGPIGLARRVARANRKLTYSLRCRGFLYDQ